MIKIFIPLIFLFISLFCYSQDSLTNNSLIIKSGNRTYDLSKLEKFEIYQFGKSNGKDSIDATFLAYSIFRKSDTLIINPKKTNINKFLDTTDNWHERKFYEIDSKVVYKIPINQITAIKAKKQPLAFVLSAIVAASYVTFIASPFVTLSNERNYNTGVKMMFISFPILITSWPSYFIFAKKRFHFDSKRKRKINWTFN